MTIPGESLPAFPSDVPASDVVQVRMDGPGHTALGAVDPPMPMTSPMGALQYTAVPLAPPRARGGSRAPMLVGVLALVVAGLGIAAFVVHRQNAEASAEEASPVDIPKKTKKQPTTQPKPTAAPTAAADPIPEDPEDLEPESTGAPTSTAAPTSTVPRPQPTTPRPTAMQTSTQPAPTATSTGGLQYPSRKPAPTSKPTPTTTTKPTPTTTTKPPPTTTTKPPPTSKPKPPKPTTTGRPVRPTRPTKPRP